MSPRPTRLRRVSNLPIISGLKPYGAGIQNKARGSVFLHLEEYEVIRLCDFEHMNHHEASKAMDISRPTLTRIYGKARAKIADALVTGKQIIIEGGKVYFDSDWYRCRNCNSYFNQPDKGSAVISCPLCRSKEIENCDAMNEDMAESHRQCSDICVCPECGYERPHEAAHPCKDQVCPVCNARLMRKNNLLAKDL
ncbi:MAG: DUF134 domain-containing protein [Bacteroidales bacterium]|nr:DUF134 domain-containing protein [Bacteroidales bacterium]MCB9029227.1 DUF134 domain-containing protein [Bacteroidales bacterium]NLD62339.1 DUF134 domain-containing protein [Bacteroidales bacterium]HOO67558.1 DUF134 domain-containing protein [Bacteroidales bacterium]HPE23480.1 DUF134 domain-containing protein [Bacteroidales bacterium]